MAWSAPRQRIGDLLGTAVRDGGVHPRFGTRNMILPMADDTYLEIVEVLDHPASDKAPFGQAVRARSALGGGWLGWVVAVDDITPVEERLGRASATGSRHRPDGTELVWQQIGVNGLIADPQLPFFIEWDSPATSTPAPVPTAASPLRAWRSPATRSGSASGSARPSRPRSRTSRSNGSPPTGPPASSPPRSRPRPGSSASEGAGGRAGRAAPVANQVERAPRARYEVVTGEPRPGGRSRHLISGTIPSPNIWRHTATYEVENRALDPHGRLDAALLAAVRWEGADVLDVGCGSGFHLPLFASRSRSIVGVEPHEGLVGLARRRTRGLDNVTVIAGTAQSLPLPASSVDIAHARSAYFFGPGCEPGLRELDRVVRRGGVALVIDNDGSRSTWGAWFRRAYPHLPAPVEVERFWSRHGWTRTPVDMGASFASREDLEAVVRIELPGPVAATVLAEHAGTEVDYAVNLWTKSF